MFYCKCKNEMRCSSAHTITLITYSIPMAKSRACRTQLSLFHTFGKRADLGNAHKTITWADPKGSWLIKCKQMMSMKVYQRAVAEQVCRMIDASSTATFNSISGKSIMKEWLMRWCLSVTQWLSQPQSLHSYTAIYRKVEGVQWSALQNNNRRGWEHDFIPQRIHTKYKCRWLQCLARQDKASGRCNLSYWPLKSTHQFEYIFNGSVALSSF